MVPRGTPTDARLNPPSTGYRRVQAGTDRVHPARGLC